MKPLTSFQSYWTVEGWLDERTMLEAESGYLRTEIGPARVFHALNDVVLARGRIVKLIQINATINDNPWPTYGLMA